MSHEPKLLVIDTKTMEVKKFQGRKLVAEIALDNIKGLPIKTVIKSLDAFRLEVVEDNFP